MGKYQPYSRRELRRRRTSWVRNNIHAVTIVALCVLAILTISTAVLVTTLSGSIRWYLLGCVHIGAVAAVLHLLNAGFLAHDRDAIWHVRGAWGEENTRDELRRAKRRRLVWGWIDSITLQAGDLDHVVVTKRGGIVAIDSKWRSQVTSGDTSEMVRAALRTKARAEGLARTVLTSERDARHRAKVQPVNVTAVVVLWGPAQHAVPDGKVIEGVTFVAGRQLVPWLRRLDGDVVAKHAARDLLDRLTNYRATAWQDV